MRILAIETSCDDTGIAILEVGRPSSHSSFAKATKDRKAASEGQGKNPDFKVLSNIVSSQTIHQNYGGVFPMMAKREHQSNLVPVLTSALKQAKLLNPKSKVQISNQFPAYAKASAGRQNPKFKTIEEILKRETELLKQLMPFLGKYKKPDVDLIAVTNGPGLEPCLWVGVNFAKALSYFWSIPVIPVNHIESHILANFLNPKPYAISPEMFPAVCLVVSGGHTQIILMKGVGKYKIIGETRDDAAGECFDKCAKILGLGYPGGPAIARIAEQWKSKIQNSKLLTTHYQPQTKLPRPMIGTKDYDFSFSGLKTAVLYAVKNYNAVNGRKTSSLNTQVFKDDDVMEKEFVGKMCVEIQQAIIDVLIKKTIKAAKDFGAKAIVLGGGVSSNSELCSEFEIKNQKGNKFRQRATKIKIIYPEKGLSTDNGLMIAVAGYFHRTKKTRWQSIKAKANLRISK